MLFFVMDVRKASIKALNVHFLQPHFTKGYPAILLLASRGRLLEVKKSDAIEVYEKMFICSPQTSW